MSRNHHSRILIRCLILFTSHHALCSLPNVLESVFGLDSIQDFEEFDFSIIDLETTAVGTDAFENLFDLDQEA